MRRWCLSCVYLRNPILIMKTALLAVAILLATSASSAQGPKESSAYPNEREKHTITPEDVLTIRELNDINLSPDGKKIAFVVNEPNDPKKPREPRASNIWVVPGDGREVPRPMIPGLSSANTPRWSPDGRMLAFLSDRGGLQANADNSTQIYLLRIGEQTGERLTSVPGGVEQYEWSRDGRMIAFIARDQATADELEKRSRGDDPIVKPESNLKYSRLWIANLSDRT